MNECTDRIAASLKALGHPVRLQVIQQLQATENPCCGDICACFELSQSTISQHLSVLVEAGLVCFHQDGNKSRYFLNETAYREVLDNLVRIAPQAEKGSI